MSSYRKTFIVLLSLILSLAVLLFLIQGKRSNLLKVYFLDIGQGDSILIQTPGGQDILIDGGPGDNINQELDKHMSFWNRDIELMILTHPHADHVDGLVQVLKRYKVDKVLGYRLDCHYAGYSEWLKLIEEKKVPFDITKLGDKFQLGKNLFLETLYPFEDISGRSFVNLNAASIVNRLCYRKDCFLFTGDAPKETEEKMLQKNLDLKADVLKVGHHGSKYSSGEDFLKAVNPKYAVIQSGQGNKFGHPHLITLRHLEKFGIEILRNDLMGEVVCESDGASVWCNNK